MGICGHWHDLDDLDHCRTDRISAGLPGPSLGDIHSFLSFLFSLFAAALRLNLFPLFFNFFQPEMCITRECADLYNEGQLGSRAGQ